MIVPDGIEPVEEWRTWTFDGNVLRSLTNNTPWNPGEPLKADCQGGTRGDWTWQFVPYGMTLEEAHKHAQTHNEYVKNTMGFSVMLSSTTPRASDSYMTYPLVQPPRGYGYAAARVSHETPHEGCSCGIYAARTHDDVPAGDVLGKVKMWGKIVPGTKGSRAEYAYPSELHVPPALAEDPAILAYGVPVVVTDSDQFGVLEVSERPHDQHAVFDGQHRLAAAVALKIDSVSCVVHQNLTPEEEAVLFTLLQTERKGLSAVDRFNASLFAGDADAITIAAVLDSYGYKIAKNKVEAVGALRRILHKHGQTHLTRTVREMKALWEGDEKLTNGRLIEGMAYFLADYGDKRYDSEVQARLRAVSPLTILRRAQDVHAGDARPAISTAAEIKKVSKVMGRARRFVKPTEDV